MIPNDPSHLPKMFSTNICKMKLETKALVVFLSGFHVFSLDFLNVHLLNIRLRPRLQCHFPTLMMMARQAQKVSNLPGWQPISTLVLVSLLRALVCVFPNKDQLRSEATDVGGIWRMMAATGERASESQSPFHQVADEICWHD